MQLSLVFSSYQIYMYLIVCIIMISLNKLIDKYFHIITSYFTWIILDILFFGISIYLNTGLWVYALLTLYLINTLIITKIGGNSKFFMFGIILAFFQSEYWEFPINIWWNRINLLSFVMFAYLIYTMYLLKFNPNIFIKNTILFSILYFVVVFMIYPLSSFRHIYIISDFFFRLICSVYFISFAYYYNKTYKVNSFNIVGGTS